MGLCSFKPHVGRLSHRESRRSQQRASSDRCEQTSLLKALFDHLWSAGRPNTAKCIQFYVAQWIQLGWVGTSSSSDASPHDAEALPELISVLLENSQQDEYSRCVRQLYALGIFRMREVLRSLDKLHEIAEEVDVGVFAPRQNYFPRRRFLEMDFVRTPHTLLQLSRVSIRRSVRMSDFERRVQTLLLPPLLLEYVWRANEMLVAAEASSVSHCEAPVQTPNTYLHPDTSNEEW